MGSFNNFTVIKIIDKDYQFNIGDGNYIVEITSTGFHCQYGNFYEYSVIDIENLCILADALDRRKKSFI